jgi:AraC-like DNA-binding protein
MPRPETCLVVRFGPTARNGLDVHVFGAQLKARRKLIRRGQRSVTARLRLGAQERVLGAPGTALPGRIVALEDLWGAPATCRLIDRLGAARDTVAAAAVLETAITERLAMASLRPGRTSLALEAADRLTTDRVNNVNAVALGLGVSERHLRRVFHETVGISPKQFARLARFHRALAAAQEQPGESWARIAAAAGYYDQAHLIAEFRSLAGATPQALLGELRPTRPASRSDLSFE